MDMPKPIPKHSLEHQRHVCRFLHISLSEYDSWWRTRIYVQWKKWNHDQMEAADLDRKKEKLLKNKPSSRSKE